MIETQFVSILNSPYTTSDDGRLNPDDSPVTTVNALCGTRIYPLVLPKQPVFPAITYSFVGGSSQATADTYGSQRQRVEVNAWGNTYSDAVNLRYAVIMALTQYTAPGIFIQFIQNIDFFDHELEEYRALSEFYITSNFGSN
jgi:hypothetical protein